jgi:tetratricopeptide (TPR) repeat protein
LRLDSAGPFPYKPIMIINVKPRPFATIVSVILLTALAGCTSVEKRYKKGQELEVQGRLEEAAQRYITVLAKDPSREDARQRLADVGAKIVDDSLAEARSSEAKGFYENAVASVIRIDSLRDRTDQVGVTIPVPDDYADLRRDMVDAAVVFLSRQGEDLEETGHWAEALQRYERMLPYPLASGQRLRVDEARARVLTRWAEQDMAIGSFRAAYGHAQNALDISGPDSEAGAESRTIQKAALDAGTKTVAVLPFWTGPGTGEGPPRGMETSLYDNLLYEHMNAPVLFVGPIDRGAIHREMSRLRVRSGEIPAPTAAKVGMALNADFVVIGWLESYLQEDSVPEEIARKAALRRDKSKTVAYTEKKYTIKLTGEVTYRIVDPATRKVVDEEKVAANASAPFRRAYYDGDYAALDLTRDERALFDKEGWLRAEEELQASLVKKLAEKIAANVFERILRFVK